MIDETSTNPLPHPLWYPKNTRHPRAKKTFKKSSFPPPPPPPHLMDISILPNIFGIIIRALPDINFSLPFARGVKTPLGIHVLMWKENVEVRRVHCNSRSPPPPKKKIKIKIKIKMLPSKREEAQWCSSPF